MTAWPADELTWARECLAEGHGVDDIAEMAERTPEDVAKALGIRRKPLSDRHALLIKRWDEGYSQKHIAGELSVSRVRISQLAAWLREQGYSLPKRPPDWISPFTDGAEMLASFERRSKGHLVDAGREPSLAA